MNHVLIIAFLNSGLIRNLLNCF